MIRKVRKKPEVVVVCSMTWSTENNKEQTVLLSSLFLKNKLLGWRTQAFRPIRAALEHQTLARLNRNKLQLFMFGLRSHWTLRDSCNLGELKTVWGTAQNWTSELQRDHHFSVQMVLKRSTAVLNVFSFLTRSVFMFFNTYLVIKYLKRGPVCEDLQYLSRFSDRGFLIKWPVSVLCNMFAEAGLVSVCRVLGF